MSLHLGLYCDRCGVFSGKDLEAYEQCAPSRLRGLAKLEGWETRRGKPHDRDLCPDCVENETTLPPGLFHAKPKSRGSP